MIAIYALIGQIGGMGCFGLAKPASLTPFKRYLNFHFNSVNFMSDERLLDRLDEVEERLVQRIGRWEAELRCQIDDLRREMRGVILLGFLRLAMLIIVLNVTGG